MSLNMNRDPVMVKFLLSELTRQRPIQQSVSLKCFVAACKMNSLNLSEVFVRIFFWKHFPKACPRSHFCENRVDSHLWASRWTNRLQEANSAGYLLLNEEPALEHEPAHVTNIGYGDCKFLSKKDNMKNPSYTKSLRHPPATTSTIVSTAGIGIN